MKCANGWVSERCFSLDNLLSHMRQKVVKIAGVFLSKESVGTFHPLATSLRCLAKKSSHAFMPSPVFADSSKISA